MILADTQGRHLVPNIGGSQKFFFDKEALKGLKSVIFPVCDEYWGGLSPPFWRILSFLPHNFWGAWAPWAPPGMAPLNILLLALWLAYTPLGNFYLQRATLRMNIWKVNGIQFLSAIFLVEIANISTNNKSSPIFLLQGLTTHNLSIYLTFFLFNNNQCSFLQNSSCLLIKC